MGKNLLEQGTRVLGLMISMVAVLGVPSEGSTFLNEPPGAPSWLQTVDIDRVIYVDQTHSQSSDSNPGSQIYPLKTIRAATQRAMENHARGFSTKVFVSPGIYREQIKMDFTRRKNDPVIIIESIEPGEVIISGSDVWTAWEKSGAKGLFVHHWPHKWGLVPYPVKWEGQVKLEPIVRRKEMVAVDGELMKQVLSYEELVEGTFFISEGTSQIFLFPSGKRKNAPLSVEVAVRSNLFQISGKKGIVVKGLTFQHAASGIQGAAVWLVDSSGILVEDCEFRLNNWTGLTLHNVDHVTTRRNRSIENGGAGMVAWKTKSYLSEDDETSGNNLRGVKGKFLYWAVGGYKVMRTHNAIFRRHQAKKNHTGGLWFDSDNSNILIEDALWCGNLKHGLFVEASQGPFTIQRNTIVNNRELGVRILYAQNVHFANNIIVNNGGPQIQLRGKEVFLVDNWETGEDIQITVSGYILEGNTIESADAVIDIDSSPEFFSSFRSRHNRWYKPVGRGPFKIGPTQLSFMEWKLRTSQDLDSTFGKTYANSSSTEKNCHYAIE
ncbi:MAG: right-handed parallel beta-helix repeat-containing protein [Nitrospirales bacterium]